MPTPLEEGRAIVHYLQCTTSQPSVQQPNLRRNRVLKREDVAHHLRYTPQKNKRMEPTSDAELDAVRARMEKVAAEDTADDAHRYYKGRKQKPLAQHTKAIAWVVQKEMGGIIVSAKTPQGEHFWNILPCGREVDLASAGFSGKLKGNGRDPVLPYTHVRVASRNPNFKTRLFYERYLKLAE